MVSAYMTYIRPVIEYASQVYSPALKCDSNKIEAVQRFFTHRALLKAGKVSRRKPISYTDRLRILELETLELRRMRLDLTFAHAVFIGLTYCPKVMSIRTLPRELRHNCTLQRDRTRTKARSQFITQRIAGPWNKMPDSIVLGDHKRFLNYVFNAI